MIGAVARRPDGHDGVLTWSPPLPPGHVARASPGRRHRKPEESPRSRDAVPDGVREAGRRDSSLHDPAVVMARRRVGVRLLGGPIECDPHGGREPVTETRELLLVLLPGLDEVVLGERVENDLEVHAAYDRRSAIRAVRWSQLTGVVSYRPAASRRRDGRSPSPARWPGVARSRAATASPRRRGGWDWFRSGGGHRRGRRPGGTARRTGCARRGACRSGRRCRRGRAPPSRRRRARARSGPR